MSVAVVIAWRDQGDPARARNLDYVLDWWNRVFPDAVYLGDDGVEPFSSYAATRAGIPSDADVLILADADAVPSPTAIEVAVRMVEEPGIVWPFTRAYYLNERPSEQFLVGTLGHPTDDDCELVSEGSPGLCLVLSRDTWEAAGGYDERFRGWGFGDTAFAVAAEQLAGPGRRLLADILHLWHPRDPHSYPDSPLYAAAATLWSRYRAAVDGGPAALRAVREEAP